MQRISFGTVVCLELLLWFYGYIGQGTVENIVTNRIHKIMCFF